MMDTAGVIVLLTVNVFTIDATNAGYARNPKKSTTDYTDFTDMGIRCNRVKSFYISAIRAIRGKIFVFHSGL